MLTSANARPIAGLGIVPRQRTIIACHSSGEDETIKVVALCALMTGVAFSVEAQTFSTQEEIDTALLPDLAPGHNSCLDRYALATHACQPVAALARPIVPPPSTDLRLCQRPTFCNSAERITSEMWFAEQRRSLSFAITAFLAGKTTSANDQPHDTGPPTSASGLRAGEPARRFQRWRPEFRRSRRRLSVRR